MVAMLPAVFTTASGTRNNEKPPPNLPCLGEGHKESRAVRKGSSTFFVPLCSVVFFCPQIYTDEHGNKA